MAVDEITNNLFMMDESYEFSAPQFYDFIHGETDDDRLKAELWFEVSMSHAPSPFMPRIKASRSVQLQSLCNFGEDEQLQKATDLAEPATSLKNTEKALAEQPNLEKSQEELVPQPTKEAGANLDVVNLDLKKALDVEAVPAEKNESILASENSSSPAKAAQGHSLTDVCTPAPVNQTDIKNRQTAKKIASMLRNPSTLNPKNRLQKSHAKTSKPATATRDTKVKNTVGTPNLAQENQAIKRQKLEGGKSRQILTISKPPNLHHKSKPGFASNPSNFSSITMKKSRKEDRKMYVREPAAPFVSMAEMMKKFQSSTREVSLSRMSSSQSVHEAVGTMQRKPKLTLTRPKTPEFETSQRARSVKIKSSAEIEEEMMAKMPKFKARPLNKKILEAPRVPALQRSTPQPPEFKEFHLETMSRAIQNSEISTVASTESTQNHHQWKPNHLTAPKSPLLQTSLRARPPKIKSSEELEKEELEKITEFRARPLNRKIFESKGDMGIFSNMKKQVTIPQEFHFAIDKRIPPPPPAAIVDLFDKLSINSEHHHDKPLPRITTPNPFHLYTEERGAEKENRIAMELMQKKLEEEMARIPKALPYPYTTDYPVIPPKPEPKACTRPEPFQLESLLRHEEEMQREIEERRKIEMEEAQMRVFKAQPILKEDPIPIPDKARKPLTDVQEFNLHVDHRAVDRAEFDKKIKEKEMTYKRYREEAESARMMEEEKALKQLRRTLVPHARPVPKFDNPFLPQKSCREATKAKSPKLRVDRRDEKRRMVLPASSTASHMR